MQERQSCAASSPHMTVFVRLHSSAQSALLVTCYSGAYVNAMVNAFDAPIKNYTQVATAYKTIILCF